MRINEIIFKKKKPTPPEISEEDIYTALEYIDENCSEFLTALKGTETFLYRGLDPKFSKTPLFKTQSPINRNPTGQSQPQQAMLDLFLKTSGFTALRTNSILCTTAESQAREFGLIYIIFPINGFSFTWSKKIPDIGSSKILANELYNCYSVKKYSIKNIPSREESDKFINDFGFKNNNLSEALLSGNEIAIHGEYIAISRYYIDLISNYFKV
jgi:hypothetical protein